jgi:hypothetical protein
MKLFCIELEVTDLTKVEKGCNPYLKENGRPESTFYTQRRVTGFFLFPMYEVSDCETNSCRRGSCGVVSNDG